MWYREIMAVCSEIHTEHINTLCGQNVELLNVKLAVHIVTTVQWGTRWRSWLRHCATSRKVAGSIRDGVTGIFLRNNPSGRTMALGLTLPLTEMSTRNISWG